jgi:hypothetical protein
LPLPPGPHGDSMSEYVILLESGEVEPGARR